MLVFALTAAYGYAQQAEESFSPTGEDGLFGNIQAVASPEGTVNCFDYYTFGSVQVDVNTSVTSVVSGTPITFTGNIVNNNPYPIVEGSLYVKIFRLRDNPAEKSANGPHVVDQFFVINSINVPTRGTVPATFSWNVPSNMPTGSYRLATFFTTNRKYNLLGLSFTDDVVGNTVSFDISGERRSLVYFDKDRVTVGDNEYFFAAFPPRIDAQAPVEVIAYVNNDTDEDVRIPVSWKLYQWDAQSELNLLTEKSESILVRRGTAAPVSFVITDAAYPVYLLEGVVNWRDTKSIINVRTVRDGVNRTRLNYPSVTAFPLAKGQKVTLFSCLHNSGNASVVPDGRLELRLVNEDRSLIHEYIYEGGVTGAMMGVAELFTPRANYDRFFLEANLYQGDTLVDQSVTSYDCTAIDPALCYAPEEKGRTVMLFGFAFTKSFLFLTLGTLFALVLAFFWWRRQRGLPDEMPAA